MLTVDDLPDEILEYVFGKLKLVDRKNVRLVNKHWMHLCNSAIISRRELFKLRRAALCEFIIHKRSFNLAVLDIYNYEMGESAEQDELFWAEHGHSIRELELWQFPCHDRILTKISNYCPNITKLRVLFNNYYDGVSIDDDAQGMEGAKLNRLVGLQLSDFSESFIAGKVFLKLVNSIPNLKSLTFTFVHLSEYLITKALTPFILKQSLTLTKLVLYWCNHATEIVVDSVLGYCGPQLTSLHLCFLSLRNVDFFSRHSNKLSNLKNLELSDLHLLDSEFLSALVTLQNLEFLSLNSSDLAHKDLQYLAKLKNLKGLDLSKTVCSEAEILKLFKTDNFTNLFALKLRNLNSLSGHALVSILPFLRNLKILDLSECRRINTRGAQHIFTNCKQLTHLFLSRCRSIRSVFNPISVNNLQNLIVLDLSGCSFEHGTVEMLHFEKLKELDVSGLRVSEEGLKKLVKNCPDLQSVSLHHSEFINMREYEVIRNTDIFRSYRRWLEVSIFKFSNVSKDHCHGEL